MKPLYLSPLKAGATLISITAMLAMTACGQKGIKPDQSVATSQLPSAAERQREIDLQLTHFPFNSAVLTSAGKASLRQDALALKQNPSIKVQAQGYCDDRGSVEYNLALGDRRAQAVKRYLQSLGIDGNRISTKSFGKADPIDPRDNEKSWALNRRASFIVLSTNKEVAER